MGRDDFAQIVLNELRREHVSTQLVIAEKKEQTGGSVVLVGQDGGRTVLVHRGAASQLDTYDLPPFWLSQTRWVHLASIGGRLATLEKLFQLLKQQREIGLSWNPGKGELELIKNNQLKISDVPCQVFFVNEEEWVSVASQQAEILANFGQVIITAGGKGGTVYLAGKPAWKFFGQNQTVVDETGAGDAFITGYVSAYLLGNSPQMSVRVIPLFCGIVSRTI